MVIEPEGGAADALRFVLGRRRAVRRRRRRVAADRRRGAALLHHMGQFMGNQRPSRLARGCVGPGCEHQICPHGIGPRAHVLRRSRGVCIAVNAHGGEIRAEPRLEEAAQRRIQRPPWCCQRRLHAGRRRALLHRVRGFGLHLLLLARRACPADPRRRVRDHGRLRHPHHLRRHRIGLMLQRIIHRADGQLRLQPPQRRLIARGRAGRGQYAQRAPAAPRPGRGQWWRRGGHNAQRAPKSQLSDSRRWEQNATRSG